MFFRLPPQQYHEHHHHIDVSGLFIQLNHRLDLIMSALDDLKAEVAAVRTVEDSAVALINGLAQALKDAQGADGSISAADAASVISDMEAGKQELADSLTANTPAAPASPGSTDAPNPDQPPSAPAA